MDEKDIELIGKCKELFNKYKRYNHIPTPLKIQLLNLSTDAQAIEILLGKYELEEIQNAGK